MITTFVFVTVAWIFFRAEGVRQPLRFIKHALFSLYSQPSQLFQSINGLSAFFYIVPIILIDWFLRRDERNLRVFKFGNSLIYVIMLIMVFFFMVKSRETSFIYFQF